LEIVKTIFNYKCFYSIIVNSTGTKYSFNINHLPKDVLIFTDEKFHNFVKELLGESTADLLNIQAINNVPSFLLSDNIADVV
jgi:hypothetical protein